MTVLAPDRPALDPPDYAAGSLLRSLGVPVGRRASWGLIRTLILSGLSFGIAPALIWPRLLRDLIYAERNQFRHLAEWMRGISGDRAMRFVTSADRIRVNPVLSYLPVILPLFVIGAFCLAFTQHAGNPADIGVSSTWGYVRNVYRPQYVTELFYIWTAGLLAAYLLHWFQLLLHLSHVRDAVTEFNHLAAAEGLAPIPVHSGVGLRPMWLIAAVLLMGGGSALWAVPAMLGGALQRRYALVGARTVQSQLADRVRQLLSHRRPAMFAPAPVTLSRKCPNDKCRAPLGKLANFCPRCGTHVGPEVNALA